MKTFLKVASAMTIAGALALAAATPSEARHGRNTAAAIGFGAGALVGVAAATAAGPYYYDEPGYAYYGPGYTYDEPDAVYVAPAPRYRAGRCWIETDSARGYGYYGAC